MANGQLDVPRTVGSWFREWLPLIMFVTSGLIWGMKLESESDINTANVMRNSESIARLEQRQSSAAERTSVQETKISVLETRLATMDNKLQNIDSKIDRLIEGQRQMKATR